MIIDELLVLLGIKADDSGARRFADSLENVSTEAQNTERSMLGAYEATDSFVSAIEGFMGVLGFFTGVLGGAWAFFHSTIADIEKLIEEEKLLTKVTKDQLDQAKKYNDSVEQLGKRYQSLKVELAFGFLPTMQRMIDAVDGFLESNKDLIVDGIGALLDIMVRTIQVFVNFIRFIDKIVEATVGWKVALGILAAAFVWLKRSMLLAFITNPIFWVIAAIGVLLLLIDDFMTYLDGGESQFGDFWGKMIKWINTAKEKWKGFSDSAKSSIKAVMVMLGMLASSSIIIKVMTTVFTVLGAAIKVLTSPITNLIKIVTMLGKAFLVMGRFLMANPLFLVAAIIAGIIYVIYDLIKWLKTGQSSFGGFWDYLAGVFNKIKAKFIEVKDGAINTFKSMIQSLKDMADNIFDAITSPFLKAFNWISDKFSGIGNLISGAVSGAKNLVGMGGASAVSNRNFNSGGNMTINAPMNITSNNPVAAGKAVQSGLGSTFNQAKRNMKVPVRN